MNKKMEAQPAPVDFDTWQANPYTKVLMKSVAEDYEPKGAQPAPVVGGPALWWNGVDREDIATGPSVSVQRSDWHTIPLYEHPVEPVVGGPVNELPTPDAVYYADSGFRTDAAGLAIWNAHMYDTGGTPYWGADAMHSHGYRKLLSARPVESVVGGAVGKFIERAVNSANAKRDRYYRLSDALQNSYSERDAGSRQAYADAAQDFGEFAYWLRDHSHYLPAISARLAESVAQPALLAARPGGDEPDRALLVSMALRLNHGFGLDTPAQQERQILNMQQVWEEVAGKGFYSQQTRERYLAMDPEAHPAQAGGEAAP